MSSEDFSHVGGGDASSANTGLLSTLHSLLKLFFSSACKDRWPACEAVN